MTRDSLLFWLAIALVVAVHLIVDPASEPFFHNDESRHVVTGVFVRDALHDFPESASNPKAYAIRYYVQYPALGLITWPPFFYMVEGAAMAVFGTSYTVSRLTLAGFAIFGGWSLFRLANLTHGPRFAALALALCAFSPLVFEHTRRVMLEVPALALVLAAVFHFERYLQPSPPIAMRGLYPRRDAILACLFASLAALTRFDGVVLLPYFGIRLIACGRLSLLLRQPVVIGIGIALAITVPYYLFTWSVYSGGIGHAAGEGTRPEDTSFLDPRNVAFYPSCLPDQVGWPLLVAALVGMIAAASGRMRALRPYLALVAATYLTFTPLAELESRHAIYWVPALAALAAGGVAFVAERAGVRIGALTGIAVLAGTMWDATTLPAWWVTGYAAAATHAVDHSAGDRPILFDGALSGNFIYHVRRADPARRLTVLRGDKVFYTTFSDPRNNYTELAGTESDVLAAIERFDPEFIVVESPHLYFSPRGADLLRDVLRKHPERFRLERSVPLRSNQADRFDGAHLEIYRKLDRGALGPAPVEVPIPALNRSVR